MCNLILPVCIVGDTHGRWERLLDKIDYYKITNSYVIHVGDIGMGFIAPDKQTRQLDLYNKAFKKRRIKFLGIRGNHDDPIYFDGRVEMSNIELLPDYTRRELNGEKFLFIGGATSIDRRIRTLNHSYWQDEAFVLKPELVTKCDVLITHTAPYWLGPFDKEGIAGWCAQDPTLWEECYQERLAMDELIKLCQPSRHYCGHFHQSAWMDSRGCQSRILDIEEIADHKSNNIPHPFAQ